MGKELVTGIKIAGCVVGPSLPMVGPVKDGGTLVVHLFGFAGGSHA